MRRRNYALAAAALVVALLAVFLFARSRNPATLSDVAPQVSVATVRYGDYAAKITGFGRVGAPAGAQAKPAFAISGILAGIDVRVGQRVQAGQALAHLDTGGLALSAAQANADAAAARANYGQGNIARAQVQTAQAKLVAARNRLEALQRGGAAAQSDVTSAQAVLRQAQIKVQTDEQNLQRQQRLFAAGIAARKDLEAAQAQLSADSAEIRAQNSRLTAAGSGLSSALLQARADYAQAMSDLRSAQAQPQVLSAQASSATSRAALAQRDYANGTLYAPMDGVVTAIYKHKGENVDSTTPVVAIGPSEQRSVTLEISASDARRVAMGNAVVVKLASSDSTATGHVVGVSPVVDPATQRATVVADAIPPGSIAGDAVEATIVIAHMRGLTIPQSAIVQDPQSGKTVVFVKSPKDGAFAQREVTVAQSDGTTALIARGIRAGEKIASQGAFELLAPSG